MAFDYTTFNPSAFLIEFPIFSEPYYIFVVDHDDEREFTVNWSQEEKESV